VYTHSRATLLCQVQVNTAEGEEEEGVGSQGVAASQSAVREAINAQLGSLVSMEAAEVRGRVLLSC
jgi:hypothetical protein